MSSVLALRAAAETTEASTEYVTFASNPEMTELIVEETTAVPGEEVEESTYNTWASNPEMTTPPFTEPPLLLNESDTVKPMTPRTEEPPTDAPDTFTAVVLPAGQFTSPDGGLLGSVLTPDDGGPEVDSETTTWGGLTPEANKETTEAKEVTTEVKQGTTQTLGGNGNTADDVRDGTTEVVAGPGDGETTESSQFTTVDPMKLLDTTQSNEETTEGRDKSSASSLRWSAKFMVLSAVLVFINF